MQRCASLADRASTDEGADDRINDRECLLVGQILQRAIAVELVGLCVGQSTEVSIAI